MPLKEREGWSEPRPLMKDTRGLSTRFQRSAERGCPDFLKSHLHIVPSMPKSSPIVTLFLMLQFKTSFMFFWFSRSSHGYQPACFKKRLWILTNHCGPRVQNRTQAARNKTRRETIIYKSSCQFYLTKPKSHIRRKGCSQTNISYPHPISQNCWKQTPGEQ